MTEAQKGHLAMLVFSGLVAGSFSLGARAAPFIDPGAMSAVRFALAGAIVGAAAWASGGMTRTAFASPWRYGVLGGLLAIYFVAMFEGLKTAPPISASAVFTLTPIVAARFGWLVLRQGVTRRMVLALTLGAVGALWVIFRGDLAAARTLAVGRGEAIYFGGCVAHALYAPMVRRLNRGEPAVVFTFGMMVAGFCLLTFYALPALRATDWAALPAIVWVTLVYVAIAASAATFVLMQYAILRLPSAKVMAYTYLTPTWVILWEIARGAEAPPLAILAGVALTGAALWLLLHEGPEHAPLARHSAR